MPEKAVQETRTRELIAQIKQGDNAKALLEAGRSGDPVFIPYLRRRLRQDLTKHRLTSQMALAKLGERDQLQAIYCQVATGTDREVSDTMDEFEYLRGWFSVRILNSVISGDLAANPRPDQSLPPDALIQFDPPNLSATRILDRLLPEAGYRGTAENTFSFWTDYVRTHEQELKKLQPTGEGVDFSPRACKNGKPVKKY